MTTLSQERLDAMAAGRARAQEQARHDARVIVDDYRHFVRREAALHAAMCRRREQGIDAEYFEMQVEHRMLWRTVTIPTDAQFAVAS